MRNSTGLWLLVIAAITILALFFIVGHPTIGDKNVGPKLGLDIQGGLRVLLASDTADVDAGKMDQARQIVERRVNALGVVEPVVQVSGNNRILVELPGIKDPQTAIDTVKQTGLLEFADFSQTGGCTASMPTAGQYILTDKQVALRGSQPVAAGTAGATAAATSQATVATAGTRAATAPAATTVVTATAVTPPPAATQAIVAPPATTVVSTATNVAPTATTQATMAPTGQSTAALDNISTPAPLFKRAQATPAATAQATAHPTGPPATQAATQVATQSAAATSAATPGATAAATAQANVIGSKGNPAKNPCTQQPFTTIMTCAGLATADPA